MKKIFRILTKIIVFFFLGSILWVLLYKFIPVPFTPLMVIRCAEQLADGRPLKLDKDWVSYENISPHLPIAVVAAEDQKFTQHFGFDIEAIKKALKHNEKSTKIRGGSTISQQTAKNAFLWPGRTYLRKGLEAYFTLLIEVFWSKKRIMTVYLNVIEMGDGIYGAKSASMNYWGKEPKNLSAEQAALIAACLPNPLKFKADKPSSYLHQRKNWILRNMRNLGGVVDYSVKKTKDKKHKK
jgi:monofunctional biosynthetic peptidoglycan transglycosylase